MFLGQENTETVGYPGPHRGAYNEEDGSPALRWASSGDAHGTIRDVRWSGEADAMSLALDRRETAERARAIDGRVALLSAKERAACYLRARPPSPILLARPTKARSIAR